MAGSAGPTACLVEVCPCVSGIIPALAGSSFADQGCFLDELCPRLLSVHALRAMKHALSPVWLSHSGGLSGNKELVRQHIQVITHFMCQLMPRLSDGITITHGHATSLLIGLYYICR